MVGSARVVPAAVIAVPSSTGVVVQEDSLVE